jgi:hypothetical protein
MESLSDAGRRAIATYSHLQGLRGDEIDNHQTSDRSVAFVPRLD